MRWSIQMRNVRLTGSIINRVGKHLALTESGLGRGDTADQQGALEDRNSLSEQLDLTPDNSLK